ncbi:hypothetical protein N0B40_10710 [Chryseobacterium oranimense]|uniref:FEKKY domain-containing protein n=1 Tax=Chryseobacterium oranimense TaxID=421058 RepID=UPI0021AF33D4|nr:hypothetical protein [Chryseobacterium oranimense]UWX58912.1 hypothetical protein N0B40_10710 [Chryseobacterium oranimense]
MKKLIVVNLAVIFLLITVYIAGYYFLNYPIQFDFWYIVKECQLQYLLAGFAITALISYLISSLGFKKLNFKDKFLRIFPVLNSLILVFLVYTATTAFVKNKRELSNLEKNYTREAENDIKKDQIVMRYAGFLLPPYDEETTRKIDGIYKKYGIISKNTGCTIDAMDIKAREKYTEITNSYLEKRNGKDWKKTMEKEIEDLKNIQNRETK